MAPTEMTVKPEHPEASQVDGKPETAQSPSTDRSTAGYLQQTVSAANKLTDPATEEILQEATLGWDDLPVKVFQPVPFVAEWKE
ncbi:uncharacterized protein RCO7_11233 [Rhynchosporium graminicola]|uniref:Uncharacterized protein n=1 Tax=Rhynchosporium graminicola TaxID=2792576 RepID=A0A1E1LAZ3_9HELO|nr:uncharacterized protein RCO7_11233 [Rhynchosporium commune]